MCSEGGCIVVYNSECMQLCRMKLAPIYEAVVGWTASSAAYKSVTVPISMAWHAHASRNLAMGGNYHLLEQFPHKISGIE